MKKHLSILLVTLIATTGLVFPLSAAAQTSDVGKTHAKVQTLSANRNQLVEVKFRDKTKMKGYITSVEPVSFTLRDAKSNASQSVAYSEVDNITKASGGISTRTWLIFGGVAAGVVTTWLIVKPAVCDGGAQTRGIC